MSPFQFQIVGIVCDSSVRFYHKYILKIKMGEFEGVSPSEKKEIKHRSPTKAGAGGAGGRQSPDRD